MSDYDFNTDEPQDSFESADDVLALLRALPGINDDKPARMAAREQMELEQTRER